MTASLRLVEGAAGDAGRDGLAQRLTALLRPEFAVEVIVPEPGDAILGTPACQVPDCGRPSSCDGMCNAHRVRWVKAGRPDRQGWVATTDPVTAGFRPLAPCTVAGCRFSQHRDHLCYHHSHAWRRQDRPAIDGWLATAEPLPQAAGAVACAVDWCGLDAELAPPHLCRSHRARWRIHGRPSLEQFLFDCAHHGRPRFDLRELKPQLRLEIQYALQCRADERRTRTTPRSIHPLLRYLAKTNATSLLDHSSEYWIAATRLGATSTLRAFVRFAIECVLDARDGIGWDSEYEADIWRLARLGLGVSRRARLDFRPITPAWLRQLAKRWMRWRISCGLALGQVRKDMVSLTRLARHTPALARSAGPQRLDRAAIEQYLAALAVAVPHPKTRSGDISVIAALLRTAHQHRWAPGLPADALIHAGDHPRHETTPTPRALPEFIMAQLENPANLAKLTDPRIRLLVEILIGTGLRFGDASRLRVDCLVRDQQGAPYLRYRNHKMRREAMVPIDDILAAAVQARQQQVRGQYPSATALFPRHTGNPDQRLPIPAATFNVHLQQWLADCHVVDESGAPVKVTAHQFRHTYATRLINSEVSQEVVRRLLDHTSHTMTSHYARLADATIREQWQRAQKVNIRGEPVDLPDDQAMAEATWMKQNLARAKITLPNGYCGLPLQKSCPHANACLTCPLFITTAEFLPHHQQQLVHTRQLITTAEAAGNDRVVQMNRTVEANLLTIITTLQRGHEPEHENCGAPTACCGQGNCCDAS